MFGKLGAIAGVLGAALAADCGLMERLREVFSSLEEVSPAILAGSELKKVYLKGVLKVEDG